MSDRSLITAGVVGVALVALCCGAPLLIVVLGGVGIAAWFSNSDLWVIAALVLGAALLGFRLYRRHVAASSCDNTTKDKGPT